MRFFYLALLTAPLFCRAQAPPAAAPPQNSPAVSSPAALPAAPTQSSFAVPSPAAPPEVGRALRARANAFLDFQSQGNFRKAYDLVAEDSRDYYFGAPKQKALSYTVDEVRYSADFATAAVRSTTKRQVMLAGHPVEIPQIETSLWKLEKGEWVWYHDPAKDLTQSIFGEVPAGAAEPVTASPLPKDLSQKAAVAAASKITAQAAVDKKSVIFILGKEATEQVKFHNSNQGTVRVYVDTKGFAGAVDVEPRDSMVGAQADLPVKISYKPSGELSQTDGTVRFMVEPFGSMYLLPVSIVRDVAAPKTGVPVAP